MQVGGGRLAAGKHERAQRLELRIEPIDLAFEPLDLGVDDGEALAARTLGLVRGAEIRAEIEQVVLDPGQNRVDVRIRAGVQTRHADHGVELVDAAVGGDPQIVFVAALAAAERGGAVVSGSRVDPVQDDHAVLTLSFAAAQRPSAHIVTMTIRMAIACSSTRQRISRWDLCGEPPRIVFHSPKPSTTATAPIAIGTIRCESRSDMHAS